MPYSRIARTISESCTLKLNARVAELRRQKVPIIHLGSGEPKGKAPQQAIDESQELFFSREIRYTPASGTVELKDAIIEYTREHYQQEIERKNVIACAGAKQALMTALEALVNPEDEVAFPAPYWVSYPEMAKLCGATPVPIHAADGSFFPSLKDVEECLSPRCKVLVINNPNNPCGAVYDESFIAGVVRLCEARGIVLIMDDIYHRLVFDHREPLSIYRHAHDLKHLVVVNAVSKTYAMTGFRTGWAVADPELIEVMARIQGHQTSGPSHLLQKAAMGAIHGDQSCVEDLRCKLEKNRDVMLRELQAIEGIKPTAPGGTFYCFVDFSRYHPNSTAFSEFLLNKALVVTVPGVEFGMEGYLRLSTCGDEADLIEGLRRLRWALDPHGPTTLDLVDRQLVRDWEQPTDVY
ncbi:MAG: aminotransferase class I/II-fold pyridoxal phosphate-dependent enzyme [Deltaproteobacteria bacterium]|nr:aminotransferase class I/II-fold pyridoxal phosphate-dependent enzyme [Deltaproteobacteria bacterium]